MLGVHSMFLDVLYLDRRKSAEPHVQGHLGCQCAELADLLEQLLRKVESGGSCCDGPSRPGVNCLVPFDIFGRSPVRTLDVGREWDFAQMSDGLGDVRSSGESQTIQALE